MASSKVQTWCGGPSMKWSPSGSGVGDRDRLRALLVAPARLADAERVEQAVLGDRLKDRLVVDLLLLRVDDELHVAHVAERLRVAGDDDHARPGGDHARHDRLHRRVGERDEQLRAPLVAGVADDVVRVAGGARRGVALELREAPVELVVLLGLQTELSVFGLGAAERGLDELNQFALAALQRHRHQVTSASSSTLRRAGLKLS
jgi:hypothetical protein